MRTAIVATVLLALGTLSWAVHASAGMLSVLSYNVRGLPLLPPLSWTRPEAPPPCR